jgi:hypothetical protein
MLIQKPLEKNDIVSVKLITGEEIIAKFESDDDNHLQVSRASIVAPNPEGGLGLVPWMMSSAPDLIKINKTTVVTYSPTVEGIATKFVEATTNIAIAK